ncbi:MAG: DUF5330 domain-containing protein [Allorhizobium sp.]
MWFLIKGTIWFSMALVALSYFSSQPSGNPNGPKLEVTDAVIAAGGVYAYLTEICSQRPEVCEKGGETLNALGLKAREGAYVAFEFLDQQFAGKAGAVKQAAAELNPAAAPADAIITGTVVPVPRVKPTS